MTDVVFSLGVVSLMAIIFPRSEESATWRRAMSSRSSGDEVLDEKHDTNRQKACHSVCAYLTHLP